MKNSFKIFFVLTVLLGVAISTTKSSAQLRQFNFGDVQNQLGNVIQPLSDGSSIVAGVNYGQVATDNTRWMVMRVAANGAIIWQKEHPFQSGTDMVRKIILTNDQQHVVIVGRYDSKAAMLVYDLNGTLVNQNYIRDETDADDHGDIYHDICQMNGGEFVAVGTHDYAPDEASGMVSVFDASYAHIYTEHYDLAEDQSDEFTGVATNGDEVFIVGQLFEDNGGSQHDTWLGRYQIGNSDGGSFIWGYRYPLVDGSNEDYNNTAGNRIFLRNNRLIITGFISTDCCGLDNNNQYILRVGLDGTSNPDLHIIYTGNTFTNGLLLAPVTDDHLFIAQNPDDIAYNPYIGGTATVSPMIAELTSLTSLTFAFVRAIPADYNKAVIDLQLQGTDLYFAGSAGSNYPQSFGGGDIYVLRSDAASLLNDKPICTLESPDIEITKYEVPVEELVKEKIFITPLTQQSFFTNDLNLEDNFICGDLPPCLLPEVTAIETEYCYFSFTVTPNPASGITPLLYIWDFGDGTITNTTTPYVSHSFSNIASYLVHVKVVGYDAANGNCCTADATVGVGCRRAREIQEKTTSVLIDIKNQVVEIFPNPANGKITVKANAYFNAIKIYNISGVNVYSQNSAKADNAIIDLANLPSGNYIVELKMEDGSLNRGKFVLN